MGIVIVNWNGWRDTVVCLESAQRLTHARFVMIVVDNASKDQSIEGLREWARSRDVLRVEYEVDTALLGGDAEAEEALETAEPIRRLVLIKSTENGGFAAGSNLGIEYALRRRYSANYVFLLNNDARVEENCLANLIEVDRVTKAGIVGAMVMDDAGQEFQFRGRISLFAEFFAPIIPYQQPPSQPDAAFWPSFRVSGTAMLIREDVLRTVYAQTGRYLDESLFLYCDELDFCFAASRAGFGAFVAGNAIVFHKGSRSVGGRYSRIPDYYWTRNRLLLSNKVLPLPWRAAFHFLYPLVCAGRVVKRIAMRRLDLASAIIFGYVDGCRGVRGRWRYQQ